MSSVPAFAPPAAGVRRLLDIAVATWAVVLIVLALLLAYDMRNTTALADSASRTAAAVDQMAQLLGPLEALPLVGPSAATIRESIHEAVARADESRGSLRRTAAFALASMLVVALGPVAVYLPLRLRWQRELALLRRALADGELPRSLREQLARRAALRLGYFELLESGAAPVPHGS